MEEIQHTSNGDHMYDDKQTCLLEENDSQCGHVYYNEITRLLKFYCTYCRETYDNIEYFCQHLSEHLSATESHIYKYENCEELLPNPDEEIYRNKAVEKELDKIEELHTSLYATISDDESTRDAFECEDELEEELTLNNKFDGDLQDSEMFIEEIEESEEIRGDMKQEFLESITEQDNCLILEENHSTGEIANSEDNANLPVAEIEPDNGKTGNSFEECFINETNIDKIRTEGVCVLKEKNLKDCHKVVPKRKSYLQDLSRLKRRRKKVTTVKVIAVKNRITELYERIQYEQQKSQQIFSNNFLNSEDQDQETQDAIESLINKAEEESTKKNLQINYAKPTSSYTGVTRKIIGETVITLIPEGTKIPNKLPSLGNKSFDDAFNKNEVLTGVNNSNRKGSDYNYNKNNDAKEKLAVCPACGKTFRSHFSLTIHKRIHYLESDSSVKLVHKCSDCNQLFNKLSQLKHHVETVHYSDGFVCKICNRQLSSLSLLERHMVKVHLGRPFNCKHCKKNFSDPLTYEEHLASHYSGEVFKCSTCGRKYATEYFLMEHMRNHKEQVPQTCVVCGKITLRITQHMKIHAPRPKRLLSCSVCGKVFNFSSGLSHHFKIMHKLPRPPPKLKKEAQTNTVKRKRRPPRPNERISNTKKKLLIQPNPVDGSFIVDSDKFPVQIIEEQIEIPHEVYDDNTTTAAILHLDTDKEGHVDKVNLQSSNSQNFLTNTQSLQQIKDNENIIQTDDAVINHKEEEAKRVIVELIQNSSYTSFFPDNFSSVLEVIPPIAREETISAVNSIAHDC